MVSSLDQATSMISAGKRDSPNEWWSSPDVCPTSRVRGFQFSTFTMLLPQTFPPASLTGQQRPDNRTYGSIPQMTKTISSEPLARNRPEWAQRTARTDPDGYQFLFSSFPLKPGTGILLTAVGGHGA